MAKKAKRYSNLYVKRRLVKLEIDIFAIIANGLKSKTPKNRILNQTKRQILDVAVQLGLSDGEKNQIWTQATTYYREIVKKTAVNRRKIEKTDTVEAQDAGNAAIYDAIRAKIQNNQLIHDANLVMYEYEKRKKHDEIYGVDGLLDTATSPFFLASSHPHPAKDHEPYQGHMFYSEDWEEKGDYQESEKEAIRAYIRNHKLLTIEYVMGEGIWFSLRRNCKHYFKNIPLDEVLHASTKTLLKRYKMYMKDVEPASQAKLAYRGYYNRLKIEESLSEIVPNSKLDKDMHNDRILLKKWGSRAKQ